MAIGDYDVVARGARVMREQPETGWRVIEGRIIEAVRATQRNVWPLMVEDPRPGSAPGDIHVGDAVLGTLVGRALTGDSDYRVVDIDVRSNGTALQEVSIALSGRFGADLPSAIERAAARSRAVIADVIGPRTDVPVHVSVLDVHR